MKSYATQAEKRSLICQLLDAPERKTQAEIARIAGVSTRTVRKIASDRIDAIMQGRMRFPPMKRGPQCEMPLVSHRKTTAELPSFGGAYTDVVPVIEINLPTASHLETPTVFYRRGSYFNGCSRQHFPKKSGVYICVDDEGRCKYVGKAGNLAQRLSGHDKIDTGDYIAWMLIPADEIDFVEAYFIGLLRPYGNFGMIAPNFQDRLQKQGDSA